MPARAAAGTTVTARLAVARDDTGAAVTSGKVACRAAVGGAPLRLVSRGFSRGAATCAWAVPRAASGKTLRGSIAVTFAGKTVTRSFAQKVN
jgi:hypothetical protein